jgi:hypothetical protein
MDQDLLGLIAKIVEVTPNDFELGSTLRKIAGITDNFTKRISIDKISEKININITEN